MTHTYTKKITHYYPKLVFISYLLFYLEALVRGIHAYRWVKKKKLFQESNNHI